MIVNPRTAGEIIIADNDVVTVGDPSYDKGTFGTVLINDIKPGVYTCTSYVGKNDFGTRPWMSEIVFNDTKAKDLAADDNNWIEFQQIGVDAGMAGYFTNKPDFNQKEWERFCNYVFDKKNFANKIKESFVKKIDEDVVGNNWEGFWTESGAGDGVYPVFKLVEKTTNKIIGLRLCF